MTNKKFSPFDGEMVMDDKSCRKENEKPDYEETISNLKELSDRLITSQEKEIIHGIVKEMQMNSPNGDFTESCEAFFTGDIRRIDIRVEVLDLYDDVRKKKLKADLELVAEKNKMDFEEMLEFVSQIASEIVQNPDA